MFEIAQRAGATTVYPWGDSYDALPNYCICSASNGGGTQNGGNATSAVGSALPNDWGIYDMAGNVWEWCQDQDSVRAGRVHAACYSGYGRKSFVKRLEYRNRCAGKRVVSRVVPLRRRKWRGLEPQFPRVARSRGLTMWEVEHEMA